MTMFERMSDSTVRQSFCDRIDIIFDGPQDKCEEIKAYILSDRCLSDIKRLEKGDYFLSVPSCRYAKRPSSCRVRKCYVYPAPDRYLLMLIAHVLKDYDEIYSDSLYSFRKHNNIQNFFQRHRTVDFNRECFVFITDIHTYSESLDLDTLLRILGDIFRDDPSFYSFLCWLLSRDIYEEYGSFIHETPPIILGNPIAAFINNIYLMDVDRYMESHFKCYMRYADDIAVFTETREEAAAAEDYLKKSFAELHLEMNPDKTALYSPGETFGILGISVSPEGHDVLPRSAERVLKQITQMRNELMKKGRQEKIPGKELMKMGIAYTDRIFGTDRMQCGVRTWAGRVFGSVTTCATLKYIDSQVQDCLRSIGSGKLGKAKYRISYKDLKQAGYQPLVHIYYRTKA